MSEQTVPIQIRLARKRAARPRLRAPSTDRLPRSPGVGVSAAILLLAVVFVLATGMRPAYDAYGWLVWGRQAVHLRLDTSAAPSWKPLTFLFTFPYALLFGRAALWLWMVTAVAGAFAAPVFAARIAYRLSAPPDGRRYAALAAAAFAGAGVLGIEGYWHFMLIATSDPMVVALSLAAIDAALAGRTRRGWWFLVLVCLGRPEALPAVAAYAAWALRRFPGLHAALLAGLLAIPLLWLGIPGLTSDSWLIAADVLANSTVPLPGNKLVAVMNGFVSLYELPMQLAVLFALLLGAVLRVRAWLLMGAAAASWLAMDVLLAWHGWGVTPRYMFEPAAVLVVLAGAAGGRLLMLDRRCVWPLRWVALAAVLAVISALAPQARIRARLVHNGIVLGRTWARQIHRLHELVQKDGRRRILACGQAVTEVPFQSILAWELDENVVEVGWNRRVWFGMGIPIVLFEPDRAGWQVRPIHSLFGPSPAACAGLATTTALN